MFSLFNICSRYDSSTGQFTVPPGGAGLYFLYVNFFTAPLQDVDFGIRVNGQLLCSAHSYMDSANGNDRGTPSCGAVAALTDGSANIRVFSITAPIMYSVICACLSVCQLNWGSVGTTDILQDNSVANLVFHVSVNAPNAGVHNPNC